MSLSARECKPLRRSKDKAKFTGSGEQILEVTDVREVLKGWTDVKPCVSKCV